MKNSELYYTLPTFRKMRRVIRRLSKKASKDCGGKATIKYYDKNGANILKSRRWRNRFMTTKTI